MAFIETASARIYWHEYGKGDPVVLIMGLGCCSAMWFRLAPKLAQKHRVIMLDNRGSGRSEAKFFVSHRISSMADDVANVLDAAGEQSAHIVGFSMGGMVAQHLAIWYPQRVRTLALLGTNCGGAHAVLAERKVTDLLFAKRQMTPEQALRAMEPHVYARETPATLIEEDHAVRLATLPNQSDFEAQLYGLMAWTSYVMLPRLQMRTLVMHGLQDRLIPPENGRRLAEQIPHSELVELPDASHWLQTDQLPIVESHLLRMFEANAHTD